ncbi:40S ribosomal protein S4-3 [Zea mays]|uniref:40S ribosomal protein S4-3 n=1 Tax=Zea mays TaxID=4577 RepID=A0A1D6H4E3_MAIZE|nr:40S ribosomal protein S4-3 [Zea mays]
MASRKRTLPRVVPSSPHLLLSPFRICAAIAGVAGAGRPRNPATGGRRVDAGAHKVSLLEQRTTTKALWQHLVLALHYY